MARPLILDVDTGVDDLAALMVAAASPEVELIGATTVFGNTDIDRTVRNTLIGLERSGLGAAEVARGASEPLEGSWQPFPIVHGEEGLGAFVPGSPDGGPSPRDAAHLIADQARAHPGELLLIATGPLTNVALALELEPRLPELLAGFTLMGGAYRHGGNVAPRAEANVWMDPVAAARVFGAWSGAERLPRCVGLEVTERVPMSMDELTQVTNPAPTSPLAELLTAAMAFYIGFHVNVGRPEGGYLHDPLAVVAALDPSLCTWQETRVEVELEGRWSRGETVTDLLGIRETPWSDWDPAANAVVATDVDVPAAKARILERLTALVRARA